MNAAKTVLKLLQNVISNPGNEKYRTVRLANKKIQSKVIRVPGAVHLLLAAGFRFLPCNSGGEASLEADVSLQDRMASVASMLEENIALFRDISRQTAADAAEERQLHVFGTYNKK